MTKGSSQSDIGSALKGNSCTCKHGDKLEDKVVHGIFFPICPLYEYYFGAFEIFMIAKYIRIMNNLRPIDLKLMQRIDKLHQDYPFAGSWMLQGRLLSEGHKVGRLHVTTLMKQRGIKAIYRRPSQRLRHKAYTRSTEKIRRHLA